MIGHERPQRALRPRMTVQDANLLRGDNRLDAALRFVTGPVSEQTLLQGIDKGPALWFFCNAKQNRLQI